MSHSFDFMIVVAEEHLSAARLKDVCGLLADGGATLFRPGTRSIYGMAADGLGELVFSTVDAALRHLANHGGLVTAWLGSDDMAISVQLPAASKALAVIEIAVQGRAPAWFDSVVLDQAAAMASRLGGIYFVALDEGSYETQVGGIDIRDFVERSWLPPLSADLVGVNSDSDMAPALQLFARKQRMNLMTNHGYLTLSTN